MESETNLSRADACVEDGTAEDEWENIDVEDEPRTPQKDRQSRTQQVCGDSRASGLIIITNYGSLSLVK